MFKIFAIALLLAIVGNCQLLRDEERPTRYVLPYSGLAGGEEPDVAEEKHYYKPNRRAERIPATAYQYDEAEEDYYRPQPQSRQKIESDAYRYQPTTPSHKDYEEILKNNHLARLRVAAKKQPQSPTPTAQPVEQYLKEVNPTTKTAYQRPTNYLRFTGQSALKQEQSEETPLKPQPYRYVLQPEQKSYPQYQFDTQQEQLKPKPPHFNIVAYQNALIAQQKLLAAETHDESPPTKSVYIPQSLKKSKKQKTTPSRQSSSSQYDYYPQVPPQRTSLTSSESIRYQQPLASRNIYSKPENYPIEDSLLYPEQKELEYQTQAPVRATKQRTTTRLPRRKPKYQTEPKYPSEPKYQSEQSEPEEYQPPVSKYQHEDQYEYQSGLKYQDEPAYRRPLPRGSKPVKYEEQEVKDEYLYQPLPKYQRESLSRRPQYQQPEPEVRPRYLTRQYQEESKHLPQYQSADLTYQPTAEVPIRQGRGPSVSYRQTYPQYQYDRRQIITPVQPKTRHSVEYQNALIAEQEEEPTVYVTSKPFTQKMYPSTQYKYHTASERQTNTLKLAPVRYRTEKRGYQVEESAEDAEPEEAASYNNYVPVQKYQDYDEQSTGAPIAKFKPENVIKKKGLHYPRRTKKRPTYLNGQFFREEIKYPVRYQLQTQNFVTEPTTNGQYFKEELKSPRRQQPQNLREFVGEEVKSVVRYQPQDLVTQPATNGLVREEVRSAVRYQPQEIVPQTPSNAQIVREEVRAPVRYQPQEIVPQTPPNAQIVREEVRAPVRYQPQEIVPQTPPNAQLVREEVRSLVRYQPQEIVPQTPSNTQLVRQEVQSPVRYQPQEITPQSPPNEQLRYQPQVLIPQSTSNEQLVRNEIRYPSQDLVPQTTSEGQFVRNEVKPLVRYPQQQLQDLVTQGSSNTPVRYASAQPDSNQPFLILVYDESADWSVRPWIVMGAVFGGSVRFASKIM